MLDTVIGALLKTGGVTGLITALFVVLLVLQDRQHRAEREKSGEKLAEAQKAHASELAALHVKCAVELAESHEKHAKELAEANRQLALEKDARIADNKAMSEVVLRTNLQVTQSVSQITEIYKNLPPLQQLAEIVRQIQRFLERQES